MIDEIINYKSIDFLPKLITDYLDNSKLLDNLYGNKPTIEGFKKAIQKKQFDQPKRKILVRCLQNGYERLEDKALQINQIKLLLNPTTFTVTTGHQICLATGPLYFIYKIISVIKLSKQLKAEFPQNDFVPIYWMATEDHDFLEINHFNTSKKTYLWQGENDIAVGEKKPSSQKIFDDLALEIGISNAGKKLIEILKIAYQEDNLAKATFKLVHELLGKYGVVIIDPNQKELKRNFIAPMKQEIALNVVSKSVNKTIIELNKQGYKAQVSPRAINLFYLTNNARERIVEKDNGYSLVTGHKSWTEAEIIEEVERFPERFSPNVLLRPLYQETILPNLAYIGGAGELSYWFELKKMFGQFETDFPILMLRNSAIIVDKPTINQMQKLKLKWSDLFLKRHLLEKKMVEVHHKPTVDLAQYKTQILLMFSELKTLTSQVDKTLESSSEVAKTHTLKAVNKFEKKLIKAKKNKLSVQLGQLNRILNHVFPKEKFQERFMNLSEVYPKIGDPLFETLLEEFDPLNPSISIIRY